MTGFGGVQEESRSACARQRRGHFACDMARFAHPGDDHPPLAIQADPAGGGKAVIETRQQGFDGPRFYGEGPAGGGQQAAGIGWVGGRAHAGDNIRPMSPQESARLIRAGLPGADVRVQSDDDTHFQARIVAEQFDGKRGVARHQLVYQTLGELMGREIHALSIEALTPAEAGRQ
jgi:acid stress-induced BolA-like protein IbaG/YrbA